MLGNSTTKKKKRLKLECRDKRRVEKKLAQCLNITVDLLRL